MTKRALFFAARRWGFSTKGKSSLRRAILAIAGIAAGVTALIVVLGVMGGLQKGYIDSILEISSFHARASIAPADLGQILDRLRKIPGVKSVIPFRETSMLAMGPSGRSLSLLVREFPGDAKIVDPGLVDALDPSSPTDFPDKAGIVLGSEAARILGAAEGGAIDLFGMVQTPDEGILPVSSILPVSGTFTSGYYEFDSAMAFVNSPAPADLGAIFRDAPSILGIKLTDRFADFQVLPLVEDVLPQNSDGVLSWRSYNKSFFGALRVEKVVMMLLISLIFVVVGVNISHSMRRTIALKMNDIAVLKAIGAENADIRCIFVLDGILIGLLGAFGGTALGLFLCRNINSIINAISSGMRFLSSLAGGLGRFSSAEQYRLFSPAFFYIDAIPIDIPLSELLFIAGMAIASTGLAAFAASGRVSAAAPSEVFRNE